MLEKLIPEKFLSVQAFSDLISAIETVISENVWSLISQLLQIRNPRTIDPGLLSFVGNQLGFNLNTYLFQSSDYIRFLSELPYFYQRNGTNVLESFLGFTRNTKITITPLWSSDYINFYSIPNGLTIDNGGDWFLTPHVNIQYLSELIPNGEDPTKVLYDLFSQLAPAHLVLNNVYGSIIATTTPPLYLGGAIILSQRYNYMYTNLINLDMCSGFAEIYL